MPRRTAGSLYLSCNSTRHARNSFGPLSQDYCKRKTHLNLEKTTFSVLSILFSINGLLYKKGCLSKKYFLFWCRMQIMEGIKYVHRLIGYPLYTVQCRVMDVQKCSTWYSVAHKRWDLIFIRIRLDWNIIDLWSFYRFYIFYILFWTDNEYCMHCIHHATEPCSVWLTTPLLQNMDYI